MLQSAEVMKKAVARLENYLEKNANVSQTKKAMRTTRPAPRSFRLVGRSAKGVAAIVNPPI